MSSNKVIWSEGMFLRPQHFQQEQRYVEHFVERKVQAVHRFLWGFDKLVLDRDLLQRGKIGIAAASGILPDGTPFNIPADASAPEPIEIGEAQKDVRVILSMQLRRAGVTEVAADQNDKGRRYFAEDLQLRDLTTGSDATASVSVAKHNLRISVYSDQGGATNSLAFAHIVERRPDGRVILDKQYIPPVLDIAADDTLRSFLDEVKNLVLHRAQALAERVAQPASGGVSEFTDFILLQLCNRYSPYLIHEAASTPFPPEAMYRTFLQMAGELGTFGNSDRLAARFEPYRHDDLWRSLHPVVDEIRKVLAGILEQTAIAIPLQDRNHGYFLGKVPDTRLFSGAEFVLAVHADISPEQIRSLFRTQTKIGPPEKIVEMVRTQLPGVELLPLPVAPRQIPYHAGFVYFALNRSSEFWKSMQTTSAIAMHISGAFPGLELEMWAIRGR